MNGTAAFALITPDEQPPATRESAVDALRGFALLGILVINAEAFSSAYYGTGLNDPAHAGMLDQLIRAALTVVFETKFYLLFSFLFGYSFVLQMRSAQRSGAAFLPRFSRRLAGLAILGLAHGWLLFAGDILLTYAVLGVALVLLRDLQARTALFLASALILATAGGWALLAWLESTAPTPWDLAAIHAQAQHATQAYRQSALDGVIQRGTDMAQGMWLVLAFIQAPCAMAMFLVGLIAARNQTIAAAAAQPQRLLEVSKWCVPLGLTGGACMAYVQWGETEFPLHAGLAAMAFNLVSSPVLAAGYLAAMLWAFCQPWGQRWVSILAPAGRMALSNYLAQSLVGALVFTAYGAKLMGQVTPAIVLAGCIALYGAQLALSRWWMTAHSYGPIEWALRALTLWQWPNWYATRTKFS